ncbi:class I SAM-dependent methyltransferase [archaeon]|nr:MAG: class I SAM-dependent methyltransferase [archaeon]
MPGRLVGACRAREARVGLRNDCAPSYTVTLMHGNCMRHVSTTGHAEARVAVETRCNADAAAASRPPPTASGSARSFADLFATQAQDYARFRPSYTSNIYASIEAYAAAHGTGTRELAADIACGSGQAGADLAKLYTRVVGVDASPEQVAQAPPVPNMTYGLGTAERTPLHDASCDLVAVAQALHWFDLPRFYTEAHRILKPRGTLAVWCYATGRLEGSDDADGDERATQALLHVYDGILGPHWDARRALVDAEYEGMEPCAPLWTRVERHHMFMTKRWPLSHVIGYVRTWSAYNTYLKRHDIVQGRPGDPALPLLQALLQAYRTKDTEREVVMTWPVGLLLATRSSV